VAVQPCSAGPSRGLFADFSWQLIGPTVFRLAAKPPRITPQGPVRYSWVFGDGQRREVAHPATVHRYHDNKPQHLVRLELRIGTRRARVVKVVTDRSAWATLRGNGAAP
jgi:hypothetical protein